jgi:hypothetical protein
MSQIDSVAAPAPLEHEFATTTVARRVALDDIDMDTALQALDPVQRAHTLAVLLTAANATTFSSRVYLAILERRADWIAERTGKPGGPAGVRCRFTGLGCRGSRLGSASSIRRLSPTSSLSGRTRRHLTAGTGQ